jgi:hypothetical protein
VSVMETFVHDPLCEWTQRKHQRSSAEEMDNPQAKDALATLEGAPPVCPCTPESSVSCMFDSADRPYLIHRCWTSQTVLWQLHCSQSR